MGAFTSALHPSAVQHCVNITRFSAKEVRMLYVCFRQAAHKNEINLTRAAFVRLFRKAFPLAHSLEFALHAFRLFDKENTGQISFVQFIQTLDVLIKGDTDVKLWLLFQLYDVENNQCLTKDSAVQLLEDLESLNAGFVPKDDVADAEFLTEAMFNKAGCDVLGFNDFTELSRESIIMGMIVEGSCQALYLPFLLGISIT